MKRTKVESGLEKQFIIGMVTSKRFILSIKPHYDSDMFRVKVLRQIAEWCMGYFGQYRKAPGKAIEGIYHSWVENEKPDEDESEAVRDFLGGISDEADANPINIVYLSDAFIKYATLKRLERLQQTIQRNVSQGDEAEALVTLQRFSQQKAAGTRAGYKPLTDRAALARAFAAPNEPLFKYPGDAGMFFNRAFTRDSLIGLQAPEKKGKTHWMYEFACRALRYRRNVAFFHCGDLSEEQATMRLHIRMAMIPQWHWQLQGVEYPTSLEIVRGDDGAEADVVHRTIKFKHTVSEADGLRAMKAFRRRFKLRGDELRFSIHSNTTINVAGIHEILMGWRLEDGYIPDIIIVDHADIIAPEDSKIEFRHQVNGTWKALRRLSQDWHACVIAPTQAAASAYETKTQGMKNFGEDKRKYGHVTGMLGLNQTPEEKDLGVMRANWLVLREADYQVKRCLWVAQCIPLGRAFIIGKFENRDSAN